jgi:hypothetical protein
MEENNMATGPSKQPVTPLKPGQSIANGIPEEYYDLIGRVVVQWSWLDGSLDGLIWDFFDLTDDDGRVVTTRMDADPKIQMLRSLVARYAPTRVDWFKALAADIDTLRLERNFTSMGLG